MNLTRDQLRAARMLLHLRQDTLAELSDLSIATVKRFETGVAIRQSQVTKIRGAVERAGAIIIAGGEPSETDVGDGVALKRKLPEATLTRIAAEERREAERIEADRLRRELKVVDVEPSTIPRRGRGRPGRKRDERGPVENEDDPT